MIATTTDTLFDAARSACEAVGIEFKDAPLDGRFHRTNVSNDSHGRGDASIMFFPDSEGGIVWNWKSDERKTFFADNGDEQLSEAEKEDRKRRRAENIRKAKEEQTRLHQAAKRQAKEIWDAASPAPDDHAYFARKGIKAHGIRLHSDGRAIIPVCDVDGAIQSIQFINDDGEKRYLEGGQVRGGSYLIDTTEGASVLCATEGFATGMTIHDATDFPVVVAFSAENLKPVALAMHKRFPNLEIVICGDDDMATKGNLGLTKARDAAEAVDGVVVMPEFGNDRPDGVSDFNDMARLHGKQAVSFVINGLVSVLSVPQGGIWLEPLPLPEGLPSVAPFGFSLLPETLQPWACDIHERMQCPPDYLAVTIMTSLGSVIGRKVGIRPQAETPWTEVSNQWGLTIGRPGVLKTPAMEEGLAPLKQLAANAAESHEAACQQYQHVARLGKLRAEAQDKAARTELNKDPNADVSKYLISTEEEAPILARYITNDTSVASLGELLRQNANGILVYRDEAVSLLKGLDREDSASERGFYLSGWNGNSAYTFDRIGRGLNLHIPAVCLSLLGSTQPGRIAEYLRRAVKGGMGDDGLIQRFGLLVWPDISPSWHDVDRCQNIDARREAHRVFEMLNGLDAECVGAQKGEFDSIPYLRFDTEGLELFREWREGWEAKLRSGDLHPALESHLAKYRKLVPGLALILHLANDMTGPVGKKATLQALAWAEYLETHARRAYASVTSLDVAAAKAILKKVRCGELSHSFATRDVYRKGWAHLSDREHVEEALQLLTDHNWVRMSRQDTEGRTATMYTVNPRGLKT